MKVLKKAEQRNVGLNREMYTIHEIYSLIEKGIVSVIDLENHCKVLKLSDLDFMYDSYDSLDNYDLRVFLSDCTTIKVIYNETYGFYENVVITKSGEEISILL